MNGSRRHVAHLLSVSVYGGPSRVVVNLLAESARRGWKATLILLERRRGRQDRLRAEAEQAGAEVVVVPVWGPVNPLAPFRLRSLLRERQVDVLHCHGYKPELYALLAEPGNAPRARVATVHGWTGGSLRLRFYEALERRLLRRFDRVFAVSADLQEELRCCGVDSRQLALIPNGFDFQAFAPPSAQETAALRQAWGIGPGRPAVGVLGRLRQEKGQDLFLRAMAEMEGGAHGVLVGEGPARGALQSLAQKLKLSPSPVFAGGTDRPLGALAAFDIAVFPSRSEGMPQALVEAMALGKPIVATSVGGMREAIRDGESGLLTPPEDPSALAGAIRRLLQEPTLAEELGQGAWRRARSHYSLEALGERIERQYEQAMDMRRGGKRP